METTKKQTSKMPIMPPKGSRDERKEFLQESVNKYLEAIEMQIGDLKKVGKNTLVISGIIVAAYALTELLLPDATPKQPNNALPSKALSGNTMATVVTEDKEDSMIWAALKGAAMSLLLTIAKEKLLGLMENLTTNHAEPNS